MIYIDVISNIALFGMKNYDRIFTDYFIYHLCSLITTQSTGFYQGVNIKTDKFASWNMEYSYFEKKNVK